eukprot:CAMPEP_0176401048 /NCGR_PEP_ID=MMETSP0126-20121128/48104_1 /TAXON_ID=141414 ORGANISM="Strombidinopsis acuminatum, Strain SPMC142" /NCGR_SAMPLE_ID=MMETSP0126 /ASSEMBLY_ACC=CAM_ASM_000229 /LENGTH=114 /DNA_ID=CAMNT_0017777707 /DNA_START=398 /DNA_END=742 /DNA_ORIENTATION=+
MAGFATDTVEYDTETNDNSWVLYSWQDEINTSSGAMTTMFRLTPDPDENSLDDVRPDAGETALGRYYVADYSNIFPVVTGQDVLGYQSATINWLSAYNGLTVGVATSILFSAML